MKRIAVLIAVLAGTLVPTPAHAATVDVFMFAGAFCAGLPANCIGPEGPASQHEIPVSRGDTVRFIFLDLPCYAADVVFPTLEGGGPIVCYHDAVAEDGSFNTGRMGIQEVPNKPDPTRALIVEVGPFDHTGRHPFICTLHSGPTGMRSTIVVSPTLPGTG